MEKFLLEPLKKVDSFEKLTNDIKNNISPILSHGIIDESLAYNAYALFSEIESSILLVTYDDIKARNLYDDLKGLGALDVEMFPRKEILFYDVDAVSHDNINQRLKVISKLASGEKMIVVTTFQALLDKIITKNEFNNYSFTLKAEDEIDLKDFTEKVINSGYERVNMVEGIGQFSIRGGIIDIFPASSLLPYRIELFGDEIDTIRTFDIHSQRSLEMREEIVVSPAKEIILDEETRIKTLDNLNLDLDKYEEDSKLYEKFSEYRIKLDENSYINNRDLILPYIPEDKLESILDYFNDGELIFFDEIRRINENYEKDKENFTFKITDMLASEEIMKSHVKVYYEDFDIREKLENKNLLYNSSLLATSSDIKPKSIYNFTTKATINYHNQIELLIEDVEFYQKQNYKTIILAGTKKKGLRLEEILNEFDIGGIKFLEEDGEINRGEVLISVGSLRNGFEYPEDKFVVLSDKQVFSVASKRKRKSDKKGEEIINISDLDIGSYVVHEDHGIGRYEGIEQIEVQGIKKDYLTIRYKDEDKLYIPIDQMNLIQKYIGSDAKKPKINRLHSGDWQRTKAKAKKAVEDMAKDLLELYATREAKEGYAFSKDTPWQREFEDDFPYEETKGQLESIEEIKEDMEKPKPMDRLLCGDVGYGKTEVALRAAFKAIMDGKQVAFLVPTTILAQQHYNTIVERFGDFPIRTALMSRFRTPGEQKKTIEELRIGEVDLVVGTHRLLSNDVKFKDLGLLIIDEEQRFGVKDKERLKQLSENIDVLTLTATPIPRTLHMSLVGIRDMSVIEEPPEERYPIQTYVMEYNEHMVREAILKEINRGGQVYFVYNRVASIDRMANELRKLVPEAKIRVAHGQMSERKLEEEMLKFAEGEGDVLVCTTIIETGLDLPNVNTIIVYNADWMGLAQLYQLRGRVGRTNRIAYGYFTYQEDKVLSQVAEKRLRAIKEFTEFGSGFKIAMRDLEIRGAGNLLGVEQHGHIEAIGYDLYVKFLGDAIKRLKGEKVEEKIETTIDLNINAYIPDGYIEDESQKIEMYKKIASLDSKEYYMDLIDELIDRFGDLPEEVENLLDISYIKSLAGKNGITNIVEINRGIKIELTEDNDIEVETIQKLSENYDRTISFSLAKNPHILFDPQDNKLKELKNLISIIDEDKKNI